MLASQIHLYFFFRKTVGLERNKFKFLLFATAIASIGGSTSFLPVFNIPVFPYGNYFVSAFSIITAYTITKFKLLDFNLVARWALAYGSLLLFIFISGGALLTMAEKISSSLGVLPGLIFLIAACSLVLILDPLKKRIVKFVDQIIFRSPDFQAILDGIEEVTKRYQTTESLCQNLIAKLKMIWGVDHAGFVIWNYKTASFELQPFAEFNNQIIGQIKEKIGKSDYLIKTLESERRLFRNGVIAEDELLALTKKSSPGEKTTFEKIRRTMRWLGAVICVPFMNQDQLAGFIILGPKKNESLYNDEDKKFLSHLVGIVAVPIKNTLEN